MYSRIGNSVLILSLNVEAGHKYNIKYWLVKTINCDKISGHLTYTPEYKGITAINNIIN